MTLGLGEQGKDYTVGSSPSVKKKKGNILKSIGKYMKLDLDFWWKMNFCFSFFEAEKSGPHNCFSGL